MLFTPKTIPLAVPLPVAYVRAVELFRLEGISGRYLIYSPDLKQGQFQARYHQYLFRVLTFLPKSYFLQFIIVSGSVEWTLHRGNSPICVRREHWALCVSAPLQRMLIIIPTVGEAHLGASLDSCSSIYWESVHGMFPPCPTLWQWHNFNWSSLTSPCYVHPSGSVGCLCQLCCLNLMCARVLHIQSKGNS